MEQGTLEGAGGIYVCSLSWELITSVSEVGSAKDSFRLTLWLALKSYWFCKNSFLYKMGSSSQLLLHRTVRAKFPIPRSDGQTIASCSGITCSQQEGFVAIWICLCWTGWSIHSGTFRKSDIPHSRQTGNVCEGSCGSVQVYMALQVPVYLPTSSNIISDSSAKFFFENSQRCPPAVIFFWL